MAPKMPAPKSIRNDRFDSVSAVSRSAPRTPRCPVDGGRRRCGMCPCVPTDDTRIAPSMISDAATP